MGRYRSIFSTADLTALDVRIEAAHGRRLRLAVTIARISSCHSCLGQATELAGLIDRGLAIMYSRQSTLVAALRLQKKAGLLPSVSMARLAAALRQARALQGARRVELEALRQSLPLNEAARAQCRALPARSRALVADARRLCAAPPSEPDSDGERSSRALVAALAAYDQALGCPSERGLPSYAAVAAYIAILPEPEAGIRQKLLAALQSR
jgi:hypothetical protein